jgi:hypothetical protein
VEMIEKGREEMRLQGGGERGGWRHHCSCVCILLCVLLDGLCNCFSEHCIALL